ncbi:MAG: terpene cyclase/mutase family protein [Planctomycetes bacterium]|nr:terpene cyclase/mutase family protein [Planctomycetota bacterium]
MARIVSLAILAIASLAPAAGAAPNTTPKASDLETSIRAALDWLVRHQNPDGSWSCHDFIARCDEKRGPCKLAEGAPDYLKAGGRGWKQHDVGVTALAVLAFAGYDHTHLAGEHPAYVEALKKAVAFLKATQIPDGEEKHFDGCIRTRVEGRDGKKKLPFEDDAELSWMYGHAIATLALADLLDASGDAEGLGSCVERAAGFCLRTRQAGFGWRYEVVPIRSDTSITGWMLAALKSVEACAKAKHIATPKSAELQKAFKGAGAWIDRATSVKTGQVGYMVAGDEGARLAKLGAVPDGYPYVQDHEMTAVGVASRLRLGQSRSGSTVRLGVERLLVKNLPAWRLRKGKDPSTVNYYYWYQGSCALSLYGGRAWTTWKAALQRALIPHQRDGGCEAGSWDPIDEWGVPGGRVYATAIAALALEPCLPERKK